MNEIVNPLTQGSLDNFMSMCRKDNKDLYRLIAQSMFDVAYDKVTDDQRSEAKRQTFMFAYSLRGSKMRYR